MTEKSDDYYKPNISNEKPVNISTNGYAGNVPAGTVDGFIKTSMEQDVIIQRISKDLYANPASGIRELYANEARACREAKRLGADPVIKLIIDPVTREIVLEGIDSMGITWSTFSKVCCVLGRSSNFDGTESGQFGMGMAAYTCISDIMFVETYSRETEEKYAVMGKSGIGFQTGLKEPDMNHFGTRVRLTARKDVDLYSIVVMVKKCAEMSNVRTMIEILKVEHLPRHSILNQIPRFIEPKTLRDKVLFKDYNNNGSVFSRQNTCKLENDGIEIVYNVALEWYANRGSEDISYLCGIPINHEYDGKYKRIVTRIAINIKDERKYQPTPDRERLKDGVAELVDRRIDSMIEEHIASLYKSITTFTEYITNTDARIIDAVYAETRMDGMVGAPEKIINFARILEMWASTVDTRKTRVGSLITGSRMLITDSLRKKVINAVNKHDPGMVVIRPESFEDNKDDFEEVGIQTMADYVKENKINISKSSANLIKRVRVYYSPCGGNDFEVLDSDRIPDDVVVINKSDFERVSKILKSEWWYGSNFNVRFVKRNAIGKNSQVGIDFDEWYKKRLGNYIYDTSMGVKTLDQIFSSKLIARKFKSDMKDVNKFIKKGIIAINASSDRVPLAVYSNLASADKHPWMRSNPWVIYKEIQKENKKPVTDVPHLKMYETTTSQELLKAFGISEDRMADSDIVSIMHAVTSIQNKDLAEAVINSKIKLKFDDFSIRKYILPVIKSLDSKKRGELCSE